MSTLIEYFTNIANGIRKVIKNENKIPALVIIHYSEVDMMGVHIRVNV